MKLWCAVVGDDSVFSVVVPESACVEDLQKEIVSTHKGMTDVVPSDLRLFLARKPSDSTWLKDSRELHDDLVNGELKDCLSPDLMLRPSWQLSSDKCFGKAPVPMDGRVHVLVHLPKAQARSAKRQKLEDSWNWKVEAEPVYAISSGRMFFVDRETPTKQLLAIHRLKFERANSGDGVVRIVPLADNVSGLGKSMFATHYIRECRNMLKESECRSAWETSELYKFEKTLCGCRTVRIELDPGSLAKNASFDAVVLELLVYELSKMFEHPPEILVDPGLSVAIFLRKLTRDVGPLFIVVDEIGRAFNDDSIDDFAKRDRFFAFCEAIVIPWLAMKSVFFVLVGAAPFLSYVGQRPPGYNESIKYTFERLNLQFLRPNAIKQIITNTRMTKAESETIQGAYKLSADQVDQVARYLFKATCGHPEQLLSAFRSCSTLDNLMRYSLVLSSQDQLALNRNATLYRPHAKRLVQLLADGTKVDLTEVVQVRDSSDATVATKKTLSLALVASRVLIEWDGPLTAATLYALPDVRAIVVQISQPLPDLIEHIWRSGLVDGYPEGFERICLKRIQDMFATPASPSEVSREFFDTPVFGSLKHVQFAETKLAFFPKITTTSGAQAFVSLDSVTAHPDHWPVLFNKMVSMVKEAAGRSMCFEPRRMSASPDRILMTLLPSNTLLTVGLAVKCFGTTTPMNMNHVWDEQTKFSQMFTGVDDDDMSIETRVNVLMVCATNYTKRLARSFEAKAWATLKLSPTFPCIHEVILLDLSTTANRETFFGLPQDKDGEIGPLTMLDKVIAKETPVYECARE